MRGPVPTRRVLARLAVLVLAVAALAVAGCGGSDNSSNDQAAAFKKDFTTVNSHILQVNEEIARTLTGQHGHTDAQFEAYMETNASGQRQILADLKALDPPTALAPQTALLTKYAGVIANDLESLVAATKIHDLKAVRKAYKDLIATSDKLQKSRQFLAKQTGAQVEQT
jgi:ABC-type glycerol-3-phosphate transport system substrate-binding protein